MTEYDPPLHESTLLTWPEVRDRVGEQSTLLLGNGGSRAISDRFSYQSLFDIAHTVAHPLVDQDDELFGQLGGTDFERVLGDLLTTKRVSEALGLRTREIRDRYQSIQAALTEALVLAHVPWSDVPADTLSVLRQEYRRYASVFTTNYDLVIYWAMMQTSPAREFDDFFRGSPLMFDLARARTESIGDATAVLYLHGGVHLRRGANGGTRKEVAGGANLLELFHIPVHMDETPFIVTEGSSAEKLQTIRGSDYLSFGLDTLAADNRPLVVFGHAMADQDEHIANALRPRADRVVAVSLQPGGDIPGRKMYYASRLGGSHMLFFDATGHPLGSPTIKVPTAPP
jgi:hypothetical protein